MKHDYLVTILLGRSIIAPKPWVAGQIQPEEEDGRIVAVFLNEKCELQVTYRVETTTDNERWGTLRTLPATWIKVREVGA